MKWNYISFFIYPQATCLECLRITGSFKVFDSELLGMGDEEHESLTGPLATLKCGPNAHLFLQGIMCIYIIKINVIYQFLILRINL
jgi:hypothetical protein